MKSDLIRLYLDLRKTFPMLKPFQAYRTAQTSLALAARLRPTVHITLNGADRLCGHVDGKMIHVAYVGWAKLNGLTEGHLCQECLVVYERRISHG